MKVEPIYTHFLAFVNWDGEVEELKVEEGTWREEFGIACNMLFCRQLRSVQAIILRDMRHMPMCEISLNPQLYRPDEPPAQDGRQHQPPPPPRRRGRKK